MKMKRSLLVLAMFGGMSSFALAADNYIGLGYGNTDPDEGVFDKSDTLKLYGGQRFGSFGYELAYHNYDKFELPGSGTGERVEGSTLEAVAVGYLELNKSFDLFGKVGLAAWDLERKDNGGVIFSDDGVDATYGIGVQFKPYKEASLRLEYTVINDASGSDLASTMLGVAFHF